MMSPARAEKDRAKSYRWHEDIMNEVVEDGHSAGDGGLRRQDVAQTQLRDALVLVGTMCVIAHVASPTKHPPRLAEATEASK